MTEGEPPKPSDRESHNDATPAIAKLIAVGVLALALIVWLSLPSTPDAPRGAPDASEVDDAASLDGGHPEPVPRPSRASIELGVIVDEEARPLADIEAAVQKLDARYCGDACGRVRELVRDKSAFSLTTMTVADWGLPDPAGRAAMGPTLTPAELASLDTRALVLVVRANGPGPPDHLPARAAIAVAAALADATGGLVYDETIRRIENAKTFAQHVITVPLGQPALRADHFSVQLYPHVEGTSRMVSLGLAHFGCPDLVMRAVRSESGPALASVLDGVAGELSRGAATSPLAIGGAEIAPVVGRSAADLGARPGARVRLTLIEAERAEGDPDNAIVEIVPPGGATPEAHDAVLRSLFGASDGSAQSPGQAAADAQQP